MRKLVAALALLIISSTAHAQAPAKPETVERLAKEVSEAYAAKNLGALDARRPYLKTVRIVIEHSLGEPTPPNEVRAVRSLGKGEQWLRSRETADGPARDVKPLRRCGRGTCTFDFDSGIVHNTLYLQKITYGYRRGTPYIKAIHFLSGD